MFNRNKCPVCGEHAVPKVERGSCCIAVTCQACGRKFQVVDGRMVGPGEKKAV